MVHGQARGRTDRAERHIAARPERLFRAWTDPAELVLWLPPRGMSGRIADFNPRPGGAFRVILRYDDATDAPGKSSDDTDEAAGQFLVIDPPRHLAFAVTFRSDDPAFAEPMRMDWHFDPDGDGTCLRIIATNVPLAIKAQDHAAGMGASLAQLAALVEQHPKD